TPHLFSASEHRIRTIRKNLFYTNGPYCPDHGFSNKSYSSAPLVCKARNLQTLRFPLLYYPSHTDGQTVSGPRSSEGFPLSDHRPVYSGISHDLLHACSALSCAVPA